jgi:aspartokinase/homoserine dehydrogenase 1
MLVMKFGGTSMKSAEIIQQVINIIEQKLLAGNSIAVIVSAMKGTTEQLWEAGQLASAGDDSFEAILQLIEDRHITTLKALVPIAHQSSGLSTLITYIKDIRALLKGIHVLRELSLRTKDHLMGYGEILSCHIVSCYFKLHHNSFRELDSRTLIKTDSEYTKANVNVAKTNALIQAAFANNPASLYLLPGFVGSDENGATTTLGRNSSDYSAAIFAAALNASSLEIWTDVSGMMTADPRSVRNVRIIKQIGYDEAMELSHFGARVIYPPTLVPVMNKGIPTLIKNTFEPDAPGTLIETRSEPNPELIRGITAINEVALITLEGSGMVGIPGFAYRLFEVLYRHGINVILITQGSSEHSVCVGIDAIAAEEAKLAIDAAFAYEIGLKKVVATKVEKDLSILAVVGENMKNRSGTSGKMFGALGRNAVNVRAIAQGSSERNISAVIATKDVVKATNVLHEAFFESSYKQIHLFIAGVGNVGSRLLAQIHQQLHYLKTKLGLQIKIVGIANSAKALNAIDGIALDEWQSLLQNENDKTLAEALKAFTEANLRNSIFVDLTANPDVADVYAGLLKKSIAVVACNKEGSSRTVDFYHHLKESANIGNTSYLFETNVGAGLPIIGTLNDLTSSGDELVKIEAVLSGTLNFVFNEYNGAESFATVVKKAQDEGYTEPDPRLDLSGKDVVKKIVILAREAGYHVEKEEIINNSFLPESCMAGSIDDFYKELTKYESHFNTLLKEAQKANCKLKFVAQFQNGKGSVGLKHISPEEDLYHLYGKDNVVLFYTKRYGAQPLVVKGAGAGADVTASGVFADILRAAR